MTHALWAAVKINDNSLPFEFCVLERVTLWGERTMKCAWWNSDCWSSEVTAGAQGAMEMDNTNIKEGIIVWPLELSYGGRDG